ncbi:ABC transporter ATP-binding protein [Propylenella binzhouense]|uniref:ABC transporter ATP-binding protein n=1 Tax=Propylenella binzhouense TaxID=2555902 RepID=UPI001968575F|nr:ABC transporter ATP-binding protein [Propylenella binzhouense]
MTAARKGLQVIPGGGEGRQDAVRIRGLGFRLLDRQKRPLPILDNVDLTLKDGEFVSIVGPSGCGKSTLLNFISGLVPVQSGSVEVFGEPPGGKDAAIGYVFQQHALLPWRPVLTNAAIGLEVAGVPREERSRRARDMLRVMGLDGFEDHYPREISGGMRQRVSLARTLVCNPRLILMDEPFGALDAQTKLLIQEMFLSYWEEHRKTVLFVTHDLAEAILLSDRILVMSSRPGRIMAEYEVGIQRPRNLEQVRHLPRFTELHDSIWENLRAEAMKAMQGRA